MLQAALDLGGVTEIRQNGTFTFNTTGVIIPPYTQLYLGYSTVISPPASSAGFTCINMGKHANGQAAGNRHSQLFGGRLTKNTGEQDWTGIEISTDDDLNGNSWTVVQDTLIYFPGTGIKFTSTGTGWTSNFHISRTIVYFPLIGVDFIKGGSRDTPFRSKFDDVSVQSLSSDPVRKTQFGFKNVYWKDLTFYNCNVWDLGTPAEQKTMTFLPGAFDIKIKGGTIARNDIGFRLEDYTTARGISIEADDWNLPTYGTEPMTSTIFVRNGRRKGGWEATAAAGGGWGMVDGVWTNHAVGGAGGAVTITYADGTAYRPYTTGAVSGNGAGIRYPHLITCRGWNPVYKIKFRLQSTSTTSRRVLFGWLGSTTLDVSADDNLNALHGCALGCRGADTTWRILHNNGTGGQGATDTGITIDTAMHTFELVGQDDITTNKWKYAIDGTWVQLPATDIPAQDAGLAPYAQIATSTTAAKGFDLFGLYVESK